ncbi:hypothetical protein OS493_022017 [Desmophyllum pertusum]|uniref:F5/8 type C domain-containing protein n=1 Tax=Desmophyllum pertusum TaxID=174260 RepID=A0A9W9YYX1_9CNID|nr:hypothetical protein OS493_022017 [Desmophyllum pertusum]
MVKTGVLNYKKDFDRHGVIYALGANFSTSPWVNPGSTSASSTRIIATRSSDDQGVASDLLENRRGGSLSGTKDEDRSWWCVDLSDKYVLYLTHYTLRHGRDNGMSIIRNWRLEGSLDGRTWKPLKKHENDRGLKEPYPYYTATWSVDGELGAFRYFRIFRRARILQGDLVFFYLVLNCTVCLLNWEVNSFSAFFLEMFDFYTIATNSKAYKLRHIVLEHPHPNPQS